MKVLFLTLAKIDNLEVQGIYTDLLRKFRENGHDLTIVSPIERKYGSKTKYINQDNVRILNVWITNFQKTNIIEKGITTLFIEYFYFHAIKKYLDYKNIDLILYSTPPITFTYLIKKLKKTSKAKTYLLLKDIFPQNAVDLNMISKKGILYKYFRRKEIELYNLSDWIGCMSKENKKYILNHNPYLNSEKIEVNPNTIYFNYDNIIVNKNYDFLKLIPQSKILFVYGGNLGKPQGIDFLLDIIYESKNNSRAFFVIVGSGTETQKIVEWFTINKPANAIFLNEIKQNEYDVLLQQCHVGLVFLNPQFTIPNYPSRILTYMKHKLPILFATDLISDVGMEAEEFNYGFWCESGNLEKFRNYVDYLTLNDTIRVKMGLNGFNRLKTDFNVDNSYNIIVNHLIT